MNRVHLFVTSLVALARFDHPDDSEHHDPREETSTAHTVNVLGRRTYGLRPSQFARAQKRRNAQVGGPLRPA